MESTNQIIDLSGEREGEDKFNRGEVMEGEEFDLGGIYLRVRFAGDGEAILEWKCGDKKGGLINKDDLWLVAFLIANDRMKEKLLPVKTEEMRVFYKQIRLKAKKNIQKGEEIRSNVKFTVPLEMLVKAHASGLYTPKK